MGLDGLVVLVVDGTNVKVERQQIMLPGLTIAIAIRLVKPRIKERFFFAVLSDPRSCLHLDVHRCKGKTNQHPAQTNVYHTIRVWQAA